MERWKNGAEHQMKKSRCLYPLLFPGGCTHVPATLTQDLESAVAQMLGEDGTERWGILTAYAAKLQLSSDS
jgi:hypothetical protein